MTNAITLSNVTKKYKEFTLDNISLTLPKGSIMGFVGENGAGKSTTIKLILDLIRRDSGSISVLGENNLKNQKHWKEKIGVVLDECSFIDTFNLENVNTIMKNAYSQWDEGAFRKYAKRFSLSPKKLMKEYSRGMKMKLSIAVALSHNAKLLILDEATSGLDPMIRDEILDVFLEFIEDENNSILISSHIISDLEKICDYITFIHDGRIVLSENKDDLLERYGILKCSNDDFTRIDKSTIIGCRKNQFGVEALVLKNKLKGNHVVDRANIEDIMLFYVKNKENIS